MEHSPYPECRWCNHLETNPIFLPGGGTMIGLPGTQEVYIVGRPWGIALICQFCLGNFQGIKRGGALDTMLDSNGSERLPLQQ